MGGGELEGTAETIATQLGPTIKVEPGTQELATDSNWWMSLHEISQIHAYCPRYLRCVLTVSTQHKVLSFFSGPFLKCYQNLNEQLQT